MKHLKNLLGLFIVLISYCSATFAQTDAEKLSNTKPATQTPAAPSAEVKEKKPAEKFFNISALDGLRNEANDALANWQTAARSSEQTLHEKFEQAKGRYLSELKNFTAKVKDSELVRKAQSEMQRMNLVK